MEEIPESHPVRPGLDLYREWGDQVRLKRLRMLWDEDCRTAVFGKTECPVGWEGNGVATMMQLVRHCHGKPAANR